MSLHQSLLSGACASDDSARFRLDLAQMKARLELAGRQFHTAFEMEALKLVQMKRVAGAAVLNITTVAEELRGVDNRLALGPKK